MKPISRKRALKALYAAGLTQLAKQVEAMTDAGWKVAQIETMDTRQPHRQPESPTGTTQKTRRTDTTNEHAPTRYAPTEEAHR